MRKSLFILFSLLLMEAQVKNRMKLTDTAALQGLTDYQSATDGVANPYGNYKDMYKYAEDLYALYAKYNFTSGRFNLTAGMRVEHSVLSPQSLTNPERNEENSYTDFFPELGFSYTIN